MVVNLELAMPLIGRGTLLPLHCPKAAAKGLSLFPAVLDVLAAALVHRNQSATTSKRMSRPHFGAQIMPVEEWEYMLLTRI